MVRILANVTEFSLRYSRARACVRALRIHTKVQEGLVKKADQILPYFAVNELPEGVAGILTAAVLGSTMSVYRYGSDSTGVFAYNP